MRIAIFSWRDIKHPYGGGAELLSHEMAKRWVLMGNEVIHFSALFPEGKRKEVIDGITYIRRGTWYNVHLYAFWFILTQKFSSIDVIVDEVHGIPFFVKLYTRKPVVCFVCEVANEVWDQMFSFPLNKIGKTFEKIYPVIYRKLPFLTISESTKKDLIKNGIAGKNITVVPMGFTYTLPRRLPKKSNHPLILFLGRLTPAKGVADAIKAFALIHKKESRAKMYILGRGTPEYEKKMKKLVAKLGLKSSISFKGFVSENQKFSYLAQSHILLVPSIREGWGLIVPEANIVGTPAVVYDVPGLSDVVKNNINGIITHQNTPEFLAEASLDLILNPTKYKRTSISSLKYAKKMNWDDTAKVSLSVLKKQIRKQR